MQLTLITTNKHKVIQAKKIFKKYNLSINHINEQYDEPSDDDNITIVKKASKFLANKYNKPVVIEDTSIFFEAYPGFPGSLAKFVFNKLGYEGIFKLLEEKTRNAHFESAVAFCIPRKNPKIFTSKMKGTLTNEVINLKKDVLPYTRIFIPEGFTQTLSELDEKTLFETLHRTKAFTKLAKYLGEMK